jgi:hypothetical protein
MSADIDGADGIDLDAYYRGLAGARLRALGDELLTLSGEAERTGAHDAAWHLSDLATQLLDLGIEVAGRRVRADERAP